MREPKKYQRRPTQVQAIRYGNEVTGEWDGEGTVLSIAQFMMGVGPTAALSEVEILQVLQPTALWDPPDAAELKMWDGVAHGKWLPLALGDWVIRGVSGEFYPCKHDIFTSTYYEVSN